MRRDSTQHGVDVLVLGDHPSAYMAAALLAKEAGLRVALVPMEDREPEDRLVAINPALFDLHKILGSLRSKLAGHPVQGLRFLHDKPGTASEHSAKSPMAGVMSYKLVQKQIASAVSKLDFELLRRDQIAIERVDEQGVMVSIGKTKWLSQILIVAGELPSEAKRLLGIPQQWESSVLHRFTTVRCESQQNLLNTDKNLLPMSLDLCGSLCWGWVLVGQGDFQIMVEEPFAKARGNSGLKLLEHWVGVLKSHGVLSQQFAFEKRAVKTIDRPLAGALEHEGVANRTLLIGPAGGFYSACGEDIYPGCWSAIFAAEVCTRALKEPHVQDALNSYRQNWRTTLGNYLRGPHENLRFLLPMVYKNPAMTTRIAEAIMLSKSVVR